MSAVTVFEDPDGEERFDSPAAGFAMGVDIVN